MNKYLTLLLILAMTLQPLQAVGCDMAKDQAVDQVTQSQNVDPDKKPCADNMPNHDDMSDCCGTSITDDQPVCDHALSCGSCYLGTPLFSSLAKVSSNPSVHHRRIITSGEILPSHDYPLLRPPIS